MNDMKEFEKQLELNVIDLDSNEKEMYLKEDILNVIDGTRNFKPQTNIQSQPQNQNGDMTKVTKNVILAFVSDATGCGAIRCHFPFSYLNFVYGKNQTLLPMISPCFVQDNNVLIRTRAIYFQRHMSPQHLNAIKWYKQNQSKYQYKMVHEMDDFLFWEDDAKTKHGVGKYNFGHVGITEEVKHSCIEIMKLMDLLIVSTQFLADYYKNQLGITVPIKVIPNYVAKFFWKDTYKPKITEKIIKPKFIYTGSPTHYSNADKLFGDWQNSAWREFIIKNVKSKKISFTCFGGLPFFFEEIKNDIKVVNWLNSYQYHLGVLQEKADFSIIPLVPNRFNFAKSDLKQCELYAAKVLGIGAYFPEAENQGPYENMKVKLKWDCSLKEIEDLVDFYSYPENYNKIIDDQYKWLIEQNRWLESPKWVNEFVSCF